ncbi:hypothetical protein ABG067_007378 [Albugo candida]
MDAVSSSTFQHAQKLRFPLPDDYFPKIKFTPQEHQMYANRMQTVLGDALEEEYWYHKTAYQSVDETQWRLMKKRKDLRVYKFTGTNVRDQNTNILAVGSIRGTIEDVMNGVHNNSTEELQATARFHEGRALDAAMLAILERGTYQDPFHFLGVKWRITKTPGTNFIRNRDACGMEYLGLARDAKGERYGFHVIEPFIHPLWPAFPRKYSVRCLARVRCIYRQIHPEIVGVFMEGNFEFHGLIPHFLVRKTMADVFLAIESSIPCAEAKRLTLLASQSTEISTDKSTHSNSTRSLHCSTASSVTRASVCPECLYGKRLRQCQICWTQCCTQCCKQKYLLARRSRVRIFCCVHCIKEANKYRSDPNKRLIFGQRVGCLPSESSYTSTPCNRRNDSPLSIENVSIWSQQEGLLSECSTESIPELASPLSSISSSEYPLAKANISDISGFFRLNFQMSR